MPEGGLIRSLGGPRTSVIALGVLLLFLAGVLAMLLADPARGVWGEDGLIEESQVLIWAQSGLIGLAFWWACRAPRQRWLVFWLGLLAALAGARELDLHIRLNPQSLGEWGVRYRLDWWTDGQVPLKVKAAWAGAAVALGLALSVPPMLARPRPFRWLRRGHLASWLLSCAFACLALGWVMDDVLRGAFESHVQLDVEELAELAGAVLFLFAVLFWISEPPE